MLKQSTLWIPEEIRGEGAEKMKTSTFYSYAVCRRFVVALLLPLCLVGRNCSSAADRRSTTTTGNTTTGDSIGSTSLLQGGSWGGGVLLAEAGEPPPTPIPPPPPATATAATTKSTSHSQTTSSTSSDSPSHHSGSQTRSVSSSSSPSPTDSHSATGRSPSSSASASWTSSPSDVETTTPTWSITPSVSSSNTARTLSFTVSPGKTDSPTRTHSLGSTATNTLSFVPTETHSASPTNTNTQSSTSSDTTTTTRSNSPTLTCYTSSPTLSSSSRKDSSNSPTISSSPTKTGTATMLIPPPTHVTAEVIATRDTATAVTSVAAIAGVAGSAGTALDAQSLAVIGLLSCAQAGDQEALKNNRLLSPLATGDSYEGMLLGNWLLVACVSGAHLAVLVATKIFLSKKASEVSSWSSAQATVRFPSWTIAVVFVQYQGTAAAAIKILQSEESGPDSLALAGFTIMMSALVLPLCHLAVHRLVTSTFHLYQHVESKEEEDRYSDGLVQPILQPPRLDSPLTAPSPPSPLHPNSTTTTNNHNPPIPMIARMLLPRGKWMPIEVRKRFGSLFGGLGRYEKLWVTLPSWSPTLVVVSLLVRPTTAAGCTAMFGTMCGLEFLLAIVILGFRPMRSLGANILSAASNICLGFVLLGLALQAEDPASTAAASLTLHGVQAQLGCTVLRLSWSLTQFLAERFLLSNLPLTAAEPDGVWVASTWGSTSERRPEEHSTLTGMSAHLLLSAEELEEDQAVKMGAVSPSIGSLSSPPSTEELTPAVAPDAQREEGGESTPSSDSRFHAITVDPALLALAEREEAAVIRAEIEGVDAEEAAEEAELLRTSNALLHSHRNAPVDGFDPLKVRRTSMKLKPPSPPYTVHSVLSPTNSSFINPLQFTQVPVEGGDAAVEDVFLLPPPLEALASGGCDTRDAVEVEGTELLSDAGREHYSS